MDQQLPDDVIKCAKDTFSLAILLGGVRAKEAQLNATGAKECS